MESKTQRDGEREYEHENGDTLAKCATIHVIFVWGLSDDRANWYFMVTCKRWYTVNTYAAERRTSALIHKVEHLHLYK